MKRHSQIPLCLLFAAAGYFAGTLRVGRPLVRRLEKTRHSVNKYKYYAHLYDIWMMTKKNGVSIEEYLLKKGIHTVAIYGTDHIGMRLYQELEDTPIQVRYAMDRNPKIKLTNLKIYNDSQWNAAKHPVDAVIVTLPFSYDTIEETLIEAGFQSIIAFDRLLLGLIDRESPDIEGMNFDHIR